MWTPTATLPESTASKVWRHASEPPIPDRPPTTPPGGRPGDGPDPGTDHRPDGRNGERNECADGGTGCGSDTGGRGDRAGERRTGTAVWIRASTEERK